MDEKYITNYQAAADVGDLIMEIPSDDDLDNNSDVGLMLHVVPGGTKSEWTHCKDLDSFFTQVYRYHQSGGFNCLVFRQFCDLLQFLFMIIFTTFLLVGVDYPVLFGYVKPDHNGAKVTISDCIYPFAVSLGRFNISLIIILCFAGCFWLVKLFYALYDYIEFISKMKSFFNSVLGIQEKDLGNVTWDEVQHRVIEVQVEQRMCIHKETLTELDIHHRILRFKNYFVAMVNKDVIPLRLDIPFYGKVMFMTKGLKYSIEYLLFNGPWAPYNKWHLRDEYKKVENRKRLDAQLRRNMIYIGLFNLFLAVPLIAYQILNLFYHYAERIKREPGTLGMRKWSHYGQLYLRHFNELDHELKARLNRGYRAGTQYMNSYTNPLTILTAKIIVFVSGSMFTVLVLLTLYDEDVIQVEHVLLLITALGAIAALFRTLIPDENQVYCPEILMSRILSDIHYIPDSWKGKAHTSFVRNEFSQLFPNKFFHFVEELFSPLITAYIFIIKMPHKALNIVDFLRNFTVAVTGVGDICSFAQMDVRKHGSKTWRPDESDDDLSRPINRDPAMKTDGGKTELSLLHFSMMNPNWKPPLESSTFLTALKTKAQNDWAALNTLPEENDLGLSMSAIGGDAFRTPWMGANLRGTGGPSPYMTGGVNRREGSRQESSNGILGSLGQSLYSSMNNDPLLDSRHGLHSIGNNSFLPSTMAQNPPDLTAMDMNVSTLYLHQLHHRNRVRVSFVDQQRPPAIPTSHEGYVYHQNEQEPLLFSGDSSCNRYDQVLINDT